ncbi:MAG: molybdenum cofactor guanylyltransferase [Candidatus Omnitrophota bacterium]
MSKKIVSSAIILAGGENKRMNGVDKAGLIVNGLSILQRSILVLKELFSEILVVTNEKRNYSLEGITVVKDIINGAGPLGGIYTGLSYMKEEAGFFVACDMPFLRGDLILKLWDNFNQADYDAIVPRRNGEIEPLHAVYKKGLKDNLSWYLNNNSGDYSIRNFLKTVNVYYLDLEDTSEFKNAFRNINTPEDIARIKKSRGRLLR